MVYFSLMFISTITIAQQKQKTILFVCEHGSAKSVVAAAHFERMAKEQGLNVQVLSRGTNPDKVIPPKINEYLRQDGFGTYSGSPEKLTSNDLKNADYVVALCSLPDSVLMNDKVKTWNIPSFEAGYPVARDSILNNIKRTIKEIKSEDLK